MQIISGLWYQTLVYFVPGTLLSCSLPSSSHIDLVFLLSVVDVVYFDFVWCNFQPNFAVSYKLTENRFYKVFIHFSPFFKKTAFQFSNFHYQNIFNIL